MAAQTTKPAQVISFNGVGEWNVTKEHGWRGFCANIESEYKWGCRRWVLHLPFGVGDGKGAYDWTAYQSAETDESRRHLRDGFVSAWKDWLKRHPDAEVIAYLGTPTNDPILQPLWDAGDFATFHRELLEPLKPIQQIGKGASLAIDASAGYPPSHPIGWLYDYARERGVKTYIEPNPAAGYENLRSAPFFVVDTHYEAWGRQPWAMPESYRKGEHISILQMPSPGKTWESEDWLARFRAPLAKGLTAAGPVSRLVEAKVTMQQVIGGK